MCSAWWNINVITSNACDKSPSSLPLTLIPLMWTRLENNQPWEFVSHQINPGNLSHIKSTLGICLTSNQPWEFVSHQINPGNLSHIKSTLGICLTSNQPWEFVSHQINPGNLSHIKSTLGICLTSNQPWEFVSHQINPGNLSHIKSTLGICLTSNQPWEFVSHQMPVIYLYGCEDLNNWFGYNSNSEKNQVSLQEINTLRRISSWFCHFGIARKWASFHLLLNLITVFSRRWMPSMLGAFPNSLNSNNKHTHTHTRTQRTATIVHSWN